MHALVTKKKNMHARSVPRNVHTPWSVWVGRRTRHTYTYIHIVFYFTLYVYTVREVRTYSKHARQKEHARPRHGRQSIARACIHSSTRRPATETGDDRDGRTKRTNERTRSSSSSSSPTRRDRESYTRARLIGVGKIHSLAARVTEKSTRGSIHSFVRFGDASGRRDDPAESLDRVDVDGLVRDPAVDG